MRYERHARMPERPTPQGIAHFSSCRRRLDSGCRALSRRRHDREDPLGPARTFFDFPLNPRHCRRRIVCRLSVASFARRVRIKKFDDAPESTSTGLSFFFVHRRSHHQMVAETQHAIESRRWRFRFAHRLDLRRKGIPSAAADVSPCSGIQSR